MNILRTWSNATEQRMYPHIQAKCIDPSKLPALNVRSASSSGKIHISPERTHTDLPSPSQPIVQDTRKYCGQSSTNIVKICLHDDRVTVTYRNGLVEEFFSSTPTGQPSVPEKEKTKSWRLLGNTSRTKSSEASANVNKNEFRFSFGATEPRGMLLWSILKSIWYYLVLAPALLLMMLLILSEVASPSPSQDFLGSFGSYLDNMVDCVVYGREQCVLYN